MTSRAFLVHLLALLTPVFVASQPAVARQCAPLSSDSLALPGTNGVVRCLLPWDPDAAGPLPPRLLIGGNFFAAGTSTTRGLIAWDGAQWIPMDAGLPPFYSSSNTGVYALVSTPSGELFAAFNSGPMNYLGAVYRWNGASWSSIGSASGAVRALTLAPSGDLLVGGDFLNIGGQPIPAIARWNGSSWSSLGAAFYSNQASVSAIAVTLNGDIIAGGQFPAVGPTPAANIARWDGSTWSAMGSGLSGSGAPLSAPQVKSLLVLTNGDVIAGGTFTSAGIPVRSIARWNGSSWSAVGGGYPGGGATGFVSTLHPLADGGWLAGGGAGATPYSAFVARWDGSSWTNIGSGMQTPWYWGASDPTSVACISLMPDGKMFAGGNFTATSGRSATFITQWDGAAWGSLTSGIDMPSAYAGTTTVGRALALNGDTLIAGSFSGIQGVAAANIARRSPAGWSAFAPGLNRAVSDVAVSQSGDLIAAGAFTSAGATAASHIARWDGTSWHALGSGIQNPFANYYKLAIMSNGDIVVSGYFSQVGTATANCIARWNGSNWFAMGQGFSTALSALLAMPGGDLIAGGSFTAAQGAAANGIVRWNGSEWLPLGLAGIGESLIINCLAALPNGDVIAAGSFAAIGGVPAACIARWNGQSWSALGQGLAGAFPSITGLGVLSNGDILAAGLFSIGGEAPSYNIARWDGGSWTAFATNLIAASTSLLILPGDQVIAVGTSNPSTSSTSLQNFGFVIRYSCPPCYPNCDSSTAPPILNVNDFGCFLNRFAAADPYANCDHSTAPPTLNVNDFQCFLNAFAAGCS